MICISVYEESFYNQLIDDKAVEEEMIQKENSKEIKTSLNELKEENRALLIFKYEMDLSYRDIGLLLGINESTVKTYLYRARNKYKDVWQKNNRG
ncbi:MAG: RNA polymerase sigma factor [Clostridium sp.]